MTPLQRRDFSSPMKNIRIKTVPAPGQHDSRTKNIFFPQQCSDSPPEGSHPCNSSRRHLHQSFDTWRARRRIYWCSAPMVIRTVTTAGAFRSATNSAHPQIFSATEVPSERARCFSFPATTGLSTMFRTQLARAGLVGAPVFTQPPRGDGNMRYVSRDDER